MSSIKDCFTSRFPDGAIVEMDYRQLEIRVLALATMCPQLIQDINNDIDLHRYFASQIYNKPQEQVTDSERKLAKGFSFQLQYGAGAKSISEHWKVSRDLVEKFIDTYYERYPEVKDWQDKNMEYCRQNNVNLGHRRTESYSTSDVDHPVHTTYVPNIWGFPGPVGSFMLDGSVRQNYKGEMQESFSPTQIKNYPIQGGAADIVLLMLTQLHLQGWVCRDHLLFINTVHDSFVFDVAGEVNGVTLREIKDLLESVPAVLEDMFGIVSPVQFPVDVSIGLTWADQKELTL